jgi:hypothetical protein
LFQHLLLASARLPGDAEMRSIHEHKRKIIYHVSKQFSMTKRFII